MSVSQRDTTNFLGSIFYLTVMKTQHKITTTNTTQTYPLCPICQYRIIPPNTIEKFHIRYLPPLVILACKYCNQTEYDLRKKIPLHFYTKAHAVQQFMLKFNICL